MNRYARQEILSEIGAEGQQRLADARVLVIGAGGLACPALQYLVGAGVGSIRIVDHDVISLSNLHRQTLYREKQIGKFKAKVAVATLGRLNVDCELKALTDALSPANVDELVTQADIILDCADSFAVSYILSDACLALGKPLISASALEFNGYVGGFCGGAPSLRAVFPDLPSRAATCATAGVLGSVVGTIGAMQAQMALTHIIGLEPSVLGQLVTVDLKRFRFGGFRFDKAVEPCDDLLKFVSPESIQADDFVVDLREIEEAAEPITPDALRYLVAEFAAQIPTPRSQQKTILCCRTGLRAWQAARHLRKYWNGEISLITQTTKES